MGNFQEALNSLETAYNLPGVSNKNAKSKDLGSKRYNLPFGIEERAKIFIFLIEVKAELADFAGAKKILQKAVVEFSSTSEEVHIIISQSNLFMKMGDIKKALNMLKKVAPDNPNFIEAKKKAAEIYLEQLRDRKNYKRCYMEIIDVDSSEANLRMVGDALMDIQEPEEAVIFYEKALQQSGDDISLVREIGKAHVMTHDYNKAIRYYETALGNDPKLLDLSTDLAELYFKLKAFDEAKRVLIDAMKSLNNMDDPDMTNSKRVQYTLLMAKIFLEEDVQSGEWRFKPNEDASKALYDALQVQEAVFDRVREISIDKVDQERKVAADINFKLAKYLEEREGDVEGAIRALDSCIKKDENHKEALFALSKLYLSQNDSDKCVYYCKQLLKIDPTDERTSFMMSNLMLLKGNTEEALDTFKTLLSEKPDNFKALSQLVQLFRRAGKTEEAHQYIEIAEKNAIRSNEAGLAYTKGLYYRYSSEPQKALKELNRSRFDSFYGVESLILMIQIYLNPHDEIIYSAKDKDAVYKTSPENMKAADTLIKELAMKEYDTTILE
jgi:tetratricopeptide repeat protein 21B